MSRAAYAWSVEKDGKDVWFLSMFKNEKNRPANQYETQNDVIHESESRGLTVTWLP